MAPNPAGTPAAEPTPLEEIERGRAGPGQGHRRSTWPRRRRRAGCGRSSTTRSPRWSDDFRRGRRDFDLADPDVVAERAFRNLAGYGPLEPLLADDDVWEIMINAPDQIFVKRHRGPSGYHDEVFHDDDHVVRTLTKILDDASTAHRKLDPTEGLQDAQLDDGARLHIVHGDIARGGHVMVNIRKFTGVAFRSLDELVARDMLDAAGGRVPPGVRAGPALDRLRRRPRLGQDDDAVVLRRRARPVAAGRDRRGGLRGRRPAARTWPACRRGPPGPTGRAVDLRRLVAGFLRMAPDVAIVGEVRDREALPLLLTLSSGVKGFTTIHAGSARQALTRLRFICQLADTSSRAPDVGAQHPRRRGDRRRRALRPDQAGLRVTEIVARRGPRRRARRHAVHRHRAVRAGAGTTSRSRGPGNLPVRAAPAARARPATTSARCSARRRRATGAESTRRRRR